MSQSQKNIAVRVKIVRFVAPDQPGWVECELVDVHGRRWKFREKVPVVTTAALTENAPYPQPGVFACELIRQEGNVIVVDTERPDGIESVEGQTLFEVMESSLVCW